MDEVTADGPSWSAVTTTLTLSIIQGIAFYAVFEFLRNSKSVESCFHPKKYSRPHRVPPQESSSWFSWIPTTLLISNEDTLSYVGLDTYVFLRFLLMCFKLSTLLSFFSLVILLPVYAYGKDDSSSTTGYNQYTMANISEGSPTLWVPLILWYVAVGLAISLFWIEWKHYMPLRQDFLARGDIDTIPEYRYTLQVERIPKTMRDPEKLYEYFSDLFPSAVVKASICFELKELENILKSRDEARNSYESAVATMEGAGNAKRPTIRVGGMICIGGEKEDAISHYKGELANLNAAAATERDKIVELCKELQSKDTELLHQTLSDHRSVKKVVLLQQNESSDNLLLARKWENLVSETGFVTLNSLTAKQQAVQCDLSGNALTVRTYPAPEPRDVIWENVTTSIITQTFKRMIANGLWILGILFWAIPVTFTQALANLEGLREKATWLLYIPDQDTALYGLLSGYLPTVLFLILMLLVPFFISLSAKKFIRMKSQSECDTYLFKWHFCFQIANLWLILIGGSIFNQLSTLIDDFETTLETIASAVTGASQFFLNILIINTFFGLFKELSNIVDVAIYIVMKKIKPDSRRSQRELDAQYEPASYEWGKVYPDYIFNFLVGIVYFCLVPIVQPFCMLFFGFAYVVFKYKALYQNGQNAEGGGAYFSLLFTFLIMCLIMAEAIMAAYFGIKKGTKQAPLAFMLIPVTAAFYQFVMEYYAKHTHTLSIQMARKLDREFENAPEIANVEDVELDISTKFDCHEYAQPALRVSKWESEPMEYRTNQYNQID